DDDSIVDPRILSRSVRFLARENDFRKAENSTLRMDSKRIKESLRRDEEMDKMKVELSEAGRMKRHMEELDCKYELFDYKNEMLARDKEYLESTLARVNATMM
nr:hypothetical protein [Tanacetum cinerariifolium]